MMLPPEKISPFYGINLSKHLLSQDVKTVAMKNVSIGTARSTLISG